MRVRSRTMRSLLMAGAVLCTVAAIPIVASANATPSPAPPGAQCVPATSSTPTGSVSLGTVLTYRVSVTNSGGSAGDCAITDSVTRDRLPTTFTMVQQPAPPAGTTMGLVAGACTPSGCADALTITWNVPNLQPGASRDFTMAIRVTGAGTVADIPAGTGRLAGLVSNSATSTAHCRNSCVVVVSTPVSFELQKTVSPTGAVPLGTTVTYAVTLRNTSQNAAAAAVAVDDQLSGTAGVRVNDGTGGTVDSFQGPAGVTVTRVSGSHYTWSIPAADVAAGTSTRVTFTGVVTSTGTTSACLLGAVGRGSLCLDNSATAAGITTVVQNPTRSPNGQVLATTTSTPNTGALNPRPITAAGFLLLGGLGLILLGLILRPAGDVPRPRLSRLLLQPTPGRPGGTVPPGPCRGDGVGGYED